MTATILNGRQLADNIQQRIQQRVQARQQAQQRVPGLAVVLIGEDPASQIYVRRKQQACDAVGFVSQSFHLDVATSEAELLKLIDTLNADTCIDGILVQLPLPAQINTHHVLDRIDPKKDVDGFHPHNLGCLIQKRPLLEPCTPKGIITLIESTGCTLAGMDAVVVGASNIVGRPTMLALVHRGATVTLCHQQTQDLPSKIKQADLLIVAIGQPKFIQAAWIKPNAIVIDVGINRQPDNSLCGDVDFDAALQVASYITPVPGGVGPMTIASLLENTLRACETFHSEP
jgi:methylenetetrahydrofolate dehydrogenase (NADP+)/methenyltetrahydrofolate cyclohydrolase